jgi:hypothetical protein
MATATAHLVEMVPNLNYFLQAGEEKLYHQQLMYIYKVLLDTVVKSSLRAILHWVMLITYEGCGGRWYPAMAEQSTAAKHYSIKNFNYLITITINDRLWRGTNKDFATHWCEQLHLPLRGVATLSSSLSLTDTVKISLLQKAVSGAPHHEVVKTQTNMLSRFIDGDVEINFA